MGVPAEDVCSNSGDLGLVLPMNDVPEVNPMTNADRYNAAACAGGGTLSVAAPDIYDAVTQAKIICARGALCPAGDVCLMTGGCLAPTAAGATPACLANKVSFSGLPSSPVPVPAIHAVVPNRDKRAYNQHLYKQVGNAGSYQVNAFTSPFLMTGAYYRIHTTHSLAVPPVTCQLPSMGNQIDCLVTASPCSIGITSVPSYSADHAAGAPVGAIKVNGVDPPPTCTSLVPYPL